MSVKCEHVTIIKNYVILNFHKIKRNKYHFIFLKKQQQQLSFFQLFTKHSLEWQNASDNREAKTCKFPTPGRLIFLMSMSPQGVGDNNTKHNCL